MNNIMKAKTSYNDEAGRRHEQIEDFEGRAFEHDGVALHIRKSGTHWILSLFNSGIRCRFAGRTIKETVELFDTYEGSMLHDAEHQRGRKLLYDLKENYNFPENENQTIDLTYKDGKLITGEKLIAGYLI